MCWFHESTRERVVFKKIRQQKYFNIPVDVLIRTNYFFFLLTHLHAFFATFLTTFLTAFLTTFLTTFFFLATIL